MTAKTHKLAHTQVAVFGFTVIAGFGCSQRNKSVCCETEVDCRALLLPEGSVGDYGCDEGLVCVDTMCVAAPDAGPQTDAPGGGSGSGSGAGRCDPAKPFDPPMLVPNINTGLAEFDFVLSSNDLEALVRRDGPADSIEFHSTSRASIDDEFPIDGEDAKLIHVGGRASMQWLARSDRLMYELGLTLKPQVAIRPSTSEPFDTPKPLGIAGVDLTSVEVKLAGTDPDALHLYFFQPNDVLQAAPMGIAEDSFGEPIAITSMPVADALVSRDGKTLFYLKANDAAGDIYMSTRATMDDVFASGTLILPGAGTPTSITKDGCDLYLTTGDIYVARRPK